VYDCHWQREQTNKTEELTTPTTVYNNNNSTKTSKYGKSSLKIVSQDKVEFEKWLINILARGERILFFGSLKHKRKTLVRFFVVFVFCERGELMAKQVLHRTHLAT
jgi:hypothetical protein